MSSCSQKYKQMLHAYELGLLSDAERDVVEKHVLDCTECFKQLSLFEKEVALLREDKEMQEFLIDLHQSTSDITVKTSQTQKIVRWTIGIAAAIALLVLSPWQLEFIPTQEAVATENKLMVVDFENIADSIDVNKYGAITANLLITDLLATQQLQIVSHQRISDVIHQLGFDNTDLLETEQLMEVARYLNVRWILTGAIIKTSPNFEMTSQLIELPDGNIVTAQYAVSKSGESIFALTDILSNLVKKDLLVSSDPTINPNLKIADITTSSLDAYRFYLSGVQNYNRFYYKEARNDFEKALTFDSTFAMAYYYLSVTKDRSLIKKALSYSENINQIEKLYIKSRAELINKQLDSATFSLQKLIDKYPDEKYAYYQLSTIQYYYKAAFDSAIVNLNQVIKIDPYFKPAYNLLVYCYTMKNNYEQAIISMDKYVALDSASANPHDTKGDLNAEFGKIDKAILSYRKALSIKPDFYSSLYQLGYMYLYKGDLIKADSCLQALSQADSKLMQSVAKMYLAYLPIRKGQYNRALSDLTNYIELDKKTDGDFIYKYFLKSILYEGLGKFESALTTLDTLLIYSSESPYTKPIDFKFYQMHLWIQNNDIAKVVTTVDSLEDLPEYSPNEFFAYWYGKGLLAYENQKFNQAAEYFLQSVSQAIKKNDYGFYNGRYMAALSYYHDGNLSDALTLFENMKTIYTSRRLFWSVWDNKMPYYLGRIYEESQWHNKAINEYELYISSMELSDFELLEIKDAKKRLAKLMISTK